MFCRATEAAPPPPPPPPSLQLIERVGSGAYSDVYKAVDRATGAVVAVKCVPADGADGGAAAVAAEVAHLLRCAQSELVVNYLATRAAPGGHQLHIVQEWMAGGSAEELLRAAAAAGRALGEDEVADLVCFATGALAFLHDTARIMHRDVKAANVLLTDDGRAKLADFGVASFLASSMSRRRTVIGSPYWMAPEVLTGEAAAYSVSADVWSLGVTAIEIAEGAPPLARLHPLRAILLIPSRAPPALARPAAWSAAFADFLALCLRKDPAQRPPARELQEHAFLTGARARIAAGGGRSLLLADLVDELCPMASATARLRGQDEAAAAARAAVDADADADADAAGGVLIAGAAAGAAGTGESAGSSADSGTVVLRPHAGATQHAASGELVAGVGPGPQQPLWLAAALKGGGVGEAVGAGAGAAGAGAGSPASTASTAAATSSSAATSVYSLLGTAAFVRRLTRPSDVQAQLQVLEAVYARDCAALRDSFEGARAALEARADALKRAE